MRKIKPGQFLRFLSRHESCLTKVTGVHEYIFFDSLFDNEDGTKINPDKNREKQLSEIRQIFPKEKEAL